MTDYSTLSDAEINAKLAKAMWWTEYRRLFWKYPDKDNGIAKENWSPCTSRDDLAVVVGHIMNREQQRLAAVRALVLEYGAAESPAIEALAAVWPEAVEGVR